MKEHANRKIKVGQIYYNYKGEEYEIIEYNNRKNVLIRFKDDLALTKTIASWDIKRARIKNPGERHAYNIGYTGNGKYSPTVHRQHHNKWIRMLDRCYSGKLPSYLGCIVKDEWHSFQNFSEWFETKLSFWKITSRPHLDKDILSETPVGKLYSPETCCLIPARLNLIFTSDLTGDSQGVHKVGNRFKVTLSDGEKGRLYLGSYSNSEDAIRTYWVSKLKLLDDVLYASANTIEEKVFEAASMKIFKLKEKHGLL